MARSQLESSPLKWLDGKKIRPYVFVREENRIKHPGALFDLDWFPFAPLYKNPLRMDSVDFANQILNLESGAFHASGMAMPRWVFYDCAVMPGFVAGFAMRTSELSPDMRRVIQPHSHAEWSPISLFIIIPTMGPGEWVAHNLSSINYALGKASRFYGLGFLTKAFGLWYANIEICCGVTQWASPAVRLHSHYGAFEVLTAYTPVHTYPQTMTYRLSVDPHYWVSFLTRSAPQKFADTFEPTGVFVHPDQKDSLVALQSRIEAGEGPYFLSASEVRNKTPQEALQLYHSAN